MNQNRKNDIMFLIKYLGKLISKDFDYRLAEYELTGQQGRILFYIAKRETCASLETHQNDIENEFHLSKSTVSGLVKRMEKKGIITVEKQHPYAVLKTTEEGQSIVKQLDGRRNESVDRLTSGLNEEDKKVAIAILNKMIINMEGDE